MQKDDIETIENLITTDTNSADDIIFDDDIDFDAIQSQLHLNTVDENKVSIDLKDLEGDLSEDFEYSKNDENLNSSLTINDIQNLNPEDVRFNLDDEKAIADISVIQLKFEQFLAFNGKEPASKIMEKHFNVPESLKKADVIVPDGEYLFLTPETIVSSTLVKPMKKHNKLHLKGGEKKYVFYIEEDNIDFIESLTVTERKRLINKVLKEQDNVYKKKKDLKEKFKFANQVVIMVFTVVISLPLFFFLLNKSIEVTIQNYQQSQQNFIKLYKEQGKIKSYRAFQTHFQ